MSHTHKIQTLPSHQEFTEAAHQRCSLLRPLPLTQTHKEHCDHDTFIHHCPEWDHTPMCGLSAIHLLEIYSLGNKSHLLRTFCMHVLQSVIYLPSSSLFYWSVVFLSYSKQNFFYQKRSHVQFHYNGPNAEQQVLNTIPNLPSLSSPAANANDLTVKLEADLEWTQKFFIYSPKSNSEGSQNFSL